MTEQTIKTLNDITANLIDSYEGYKKCLEISQEDYALRENFLSRAKERSQLINEFQAEVRQLGGDPTVQGSLAGRIHRGFTDFSARFQDNEKAAIDAIDDGEDFLADKIANALEKKDLTPSARALLTRAHASAKAGERYADMIEDAM